MTEMREPIQIGAEIYGHAGHRERRRDRAADDRGAAARGLERVHVDLGNPAIYRAMARGGSTPSRGRSCSTRCSRRTCRALDALTATLAARDARRSRRCPSSRRRRSARARAARAAGARDRRALARLQALAMRCAPAWRFLFDLAELGGFNYESGLVFAAFAAGQPRRDRARRALRRGRQGVRPGAAGDGIHDGSAPARGVGAHGDPAAGRDPRAAVPRRRGAAGAIAEAARAGRDVVGGAAGRTRRHRRARMRTRGSR